MSRGYTPKDYRDLYLIAHALNDGIDGAIQDCDHFRSVVPGWEREDGYEQACKKACLENAKPVAEALILFADKKGKLNPLEKEKVGFALAAQPQLFGDKDPEFRPLVLHPKQMDRSMGSFHNNIGGQIDAQLPATDQPFKFRGTPKVDYDEAIAAASKWLKEYPSRSLALFLKQHPAIREQIHELAAPAIELREQLLKTIDKAYDHPGRKLGDHEGMDRQAVGSYFWHAERKYKPKPAPAAAVALHAELEAWGKAIGSLGRVYEALKPLTRADIILLKESRPLWERLKTGIAALQKDGIWPPPDKEQAAAIARLDYVAAEVTDALSTRFTDIVPPPRGSGPESAVRRDVPPTR